MPEYRDVENTLEVAIAERMPKSLSSGSFTIGPGLLDLADQDFGKVVNTILERANFIGAEIQLCVEKARQIRSFDERIVKNTQNATVDWSR